MFALHIQCKNDGTGSFIALNFAFLHVYAGSHWPSAYELRPPWSRSFVLGVLSFFLCSVLSN